MMTKVREESSYAVTIDIRMDIQHNLLLFVLTIVYMMNLNVRGLDSFLRPQIDSRTSIKINGCYSLLKLCHSSSKCQ